MPYMPKGDRYDVNRENRKAAAKPYATKRWRSLRKAQLRVEPMCRSCHESGKVVEATLVDHVIPHRGDMRLFFDVDNLQSLCVTCHDKKTKAGY